MSKPAVLLSAISAAILGFSGMAAAYDSDPGYGDGRWYGGRRDQQYQSIGANGTIPLYYRPTQRYYGAGYTVSYRFIPVYRSDSAQSVPVTGAANFRTEAFHLPAEDAAMWGAGSPRLTVKDPKSGTPRTAVTTIVRKKTTTKTTGKTPSKASDEIIPAITPSTAAPAIPDGAPIAPDATAAPQPAPDPAKP
jgi:hypothetical protein